MQAVLPTKTSIFINNGDFGLDNSNSMKFEHNAISQQEPLITSSEIDPGVTLVAEPPKMDEGDEVVIQCDDQPVRQVHLDVNRKQTEVFEAAATEQQLTGDEVQKVDVSEGQNYEP